MLRLSLLSFALGVLAIASGLGHVAGFSFELGRFLFFSFLIIAILTFVAAIVSDRRAGWDRPGR